jgi:hypothetical protein
MKRLLSVILWCVVILLIQSNAFPSTIIVAKSGGAYNAIQAAVTAANAGDTVLVRAGTYYEAVSFGKSGITTGYITLKGEAGAIIDGTGKGELGIAIANRNYIKVIGMEVQNFKGNGTPIGISIEGSSSNLELRDNKVHNIENANGNAHGIAFYGTSATPISNITVDGNEIYNCKLGQSESMVLNGNVANFTVTNNVVHDNDNIGIDFIGFEGNGPTDQDQARSGACVGNHVYNICSATNPTYGGERSADGIYVDGGKDIIIERNIVDNCDIGIEVASEHGGKTTSGITVRSNFVSRSYQGNIMSGGYAANRGNAANIVIVNNTLYHGQGGELILQYNCNGITIKNNICVANSGTDYLSNSGGNNTNITVDNNLYYGASTSSPGSWNDANAKYSNPLLVNAPTDMHIQPASPAKNSGVTLTADIAGTLDIDGQARIQESLIDIGADESGTTTILDQRQTSQRKHAGIFSTERSTIIYGIDPGAQTTVHFFSTDGKCVRTVAGKNSGGMMVIDNAGLAAGRYWVSASSEEKMLTGMVGVFKNRNSYRPGF